MPGRGAQAPLAAPSPDAASRRERILWAAAVAYLLLIYASAYFVQFLLDALIRRGLLGWTIDLVFSLTVAGLGWALLHHRPRPRDLLLLAAGAALYGPILFYLEILQERLHFLEYGGLGLLFWLAVRERLGPRRVVKVALVAVALTGAAGWLDEGIQWLLPNRYYDLRDVGFNALAGALAVGLAVAWSHPTRAGEATRE
jgi:hypothetical protein